MRLKRYLFILGATYFILIGSTYYYQIFAVRVFQHLFVTIILSIWLMVRIIKRRGLPRTPLNTLIYINVAVWFVSALLSLDPRMALENLWVPLTDLMLFFVMVDLLQTGWEGLLIETQFLLAALVVILSGFQLGSWFFGWGFATPTVGRAAVLGADMPLPLSAPRLFVPLGVTTWLAAYTAPLAVVAGAWGLAARWRGARIGLWLLALLLVIVMMLTGSRGGWFSLAAGAGGFLVLHLLGDLRFRQIVFRYRVPVLIALAAAGAIGVFTVIRLSADSGHSTGDILRLDLWRGAAAVAADYPFLGVGPGLFGNAYRLYRDPGNVDNRLGTAHNFYLNSLAETGVAGGLVALGLGIALLRAWWRLWSSAKMPERKIYLEAALAALVGFGVQSVFDMFTSVTLVLLALLLAAYCCTAVRSRIDPPLKGSNFAALASLVIVLAFGLGLVRSDQAQAAFNTSVNSRDPAQAQQAAALDPSLRLYDLQNAYLTGLNDDPAQAIAAYQHALELEPTWDMGWINLAALLERQGENEQALDALEKAINIDNHNGALLLWARLAEQTGAASGDALCAAYLRALNTSYQALPLSSFWSQTEPRKQALALYLQPLALDVRYRVMATQVGDDLASVVPAAPVSAADWWVVGEYALSVENDAAKAEQAFSQAIALNRDFTLGDYYASRARARVTIDQQGAIRDLNTADLLGTYYESTNAVRARLAPTVGERRRLLAAAVPPRIIAQDFEGVLFTGRVAAFEPLAEMRPPGPGRSVLQPWYDLAASYSADGEIAQAIHVYQAILDRAPEETDARDQMARLSES